MGARFFFSSIAWRTVLLSLWLMLDLSGCSTTTAVQLAGAAVNLALETTGLKQKSSDGASVPYQVPMTVSTGTELNTTSDGQSLALVLKVYQLRTPQAFMVLTYTDASSADGGKEILGSDLISYKEITVVPGRTYDLKQSIPGDGTTIGIVGLFRAPANNRWKIAFDAKASRDSGITVGAHACALTAGLGALSLDISAETDRSLSGIQCSG